MLPLADDAVFLNYRNIACARCATEKERPADYKQGICVYSSGVKSNISVTGKAIKDSVDALIAHGCTRCGSVPIVPGAKDETDGNIQINFVRGACETGLCPQHVARDVKESVTAEASANTVNAVRIDSASTYNDESVVNEYATTPRSAAPGSASTLLGISCHGSSRCTKTCGRTIHELKIYIDKLVKSPSTFEPAITDNVLRFRQLG